jgi:hypothetical protein
MGKHVNRDNVNKQRQWLRPDDRTSTQTGTQILVLDITVSSLAAGPTKPPSQRVLGLFSRE